MKKAFLFLLLLPSFCVAQLDRVRVNMTEQEFIKAFPEAHRDYESESYWTNRWDTLEGSAGNSLWRIMNDSVREYNFRGLKADGPSYRFPTVDSARVHKQRESANKLIASLEKKFGKATTYRSKDLLSRPKNPDGNHDPQIQTAEFNELVFAQWSFDDGNVVIVRLSSDMSPGNRINAPAVQQTQQSESYELDVTVTRKAADAYHFCIGTSAHDLFKRFPNVTPQPTAITHIYRFKDEEIAPYAEWNFIFVNAVIQSFNYNNNSSGGGEKRDPDLVYNGDRYRAEKLMAEGNKSFGAPKILENTIDAMYQPSDLATAYRKSYLSVAWDTPTGLVTLTFEEMGGGKNGNVRFYVNVNYNRDR